MDLEEKLRYLSGQDDPYEKPKPVSHTSDDAPHSINPNMVSTDDDDSVDSISIDSYLGWNDHKASKKKKGKKAERPEFFDDFDEEDLMDPSTTGSKEINRLRSSKFYNKMVKRMPSSMIGELEEFLGDDSAFEDEEGQELRNGLISMGRKYARDTGINSDTSEIAKTFAASEKKLKDLCDEIDRDKVNIQRDIDQLRSMTRGRNYKALSDLNSAKTSYHSTQLQAIKEMNSIKKSIFEMRMKERAAKAAAGDTENTDISTNTIRSLFSAGRNDIVNATGGYSKVSGAVNSISSNPSNMDMSDDEIEDRYFADEPDEETDGDKFLEYEGQGVEYYLLVDETDAPVEVVAKDRDGNIVPDYPMPSNVENLRFSINTTTQSAEDDLHRKYKLERV